MPDPNGPSHDTEQPDSLRTDALRSAGVRLRRHRTAAGITQDQLAASANIAIRTLRNIESGALRPRRATLEQLATALGLTDRAGFLETWHAYDDGRDRSDDGLLRTPTGIDGLLSPAARRARSIEDIVMKSDRVVIGRERTTDRLHVRHVSRARADGLDRTTAVVHTPQLVDWDRLTLTDLDNCRLSTQTVYPEAPAKSFEMRYDRTLRAGELHPVEYTVDYAAVRLAGAADRPCTDAGTGVRQAGTTVTLQATFPLDDLPATVLYEFSDRSGAEPPVREPVRISPQGSAYVLREKAAVGMHSIVWTWPS